jgi:hypothetical protein
VVRKSQLLNLAGSRRKSRNVAQHLHFDDEGNPIENPLLKDVKTTAANTKADDSDLDSDEFLTAEEEEENNGCKEEFFDSCEGEQKQQEDLKSHDDTTKMAVRNSACS